MFYEDQSDYIMDNNVKEAWTNCDQNATSSFEYGSMMSQQLVSQDAQHMKTIVEQSSTSSTEMTTLNQANEKKQAKSKRTRTAYTSLQLMQLETEFQTGRYLCRSRRIQISTALNLTEKQIKVWFQNRRMKHKRDNKSDIKSLNGLPNDQTKLASYSRNASACSAKHIFNMTTNNPKSPTSMILKNNNVQTFTPNLSCAYPSDTSQGILQNGLAMQNYGIIDQQQFKQAEQNYSATVQQAQISYNVLPDQASCNYQEQGFYSHQQQTNYSASYYLEPQMDNNLLQQQWKYDCMQNNSDVNSYAQVQSDADTNIVSNTDISDQITSILMSENEENHNLNNISSLPSFSSWFTENSNQLINENIHQLTNISPTVSQNIDSNWLNL